MQILACIGKNWTIVSQQSQPAVALGALQSLYHESDYDEENDQQPPRLDNVDRVKQRRSEWKKIDGQDGMRSLLAWTAHSQYRGIMIVQA